MALSAASQQTVDNWRERGVLLRYHEDLLGVWEQDSAQNYPFFQDATLPPEAQLNEHERFGNLNYAAQMRIWSANQRLERINNQYHPNNAQFAPYLALPLPRRLHIGEDLEVAPFFSDLGSALDAVTGQIVLIYGFPIELRMVGWRALADLLSRMAAPFDTATRPPRSGDRQIYNVMPSGNLINVVLHAGNNLPDWVDALISYRNNFTHRTFFATILDREGFYLPRDASALPSLVLNPIEREREAGNQVGVAHLKNQFFSPLPLHEYCQDVYGRVRGLIEQVYEQILNTYQARLNNPGAVTNPHRLYQFGL